MLFRVTEQRGDKRKSIAIAAKAEELGPIVFLRRDVSISDFIVVLRQFVKGYMTPQKAAKWQYNEVETMPKTLDLDALYWEDAPGNPVILTETITFYHSASPYGKSFLRGGYDVHRMIDVFLSQMTRTTAVTPAIWLDHVADSLRIGRDGLDDAEIEARYLEKTRKAPELPQLGQPAAFFDPSVPVVDVLAELTWEELPPGVYDLLNRWLASSVRIMNDIGPSWSLDPGRTYIEDVELFEGSGQHVRVIAKNGQGNIIEVSVHGTEGSKVLSKPLYQYRIVMD